VHSGSCAKMTRAEALYLAKDTVTKALAEMKNENIRAIFCPETMGKINQLGTLSEVLELCSLDEAMLPCVDFGHLNARTLGGIKTIDDYAKMLDEIEDKLGFDRLAQMHVHFSKIEYTAGGEKRHLTFDDTTFGPDYEPLMELFAKRNLNCTVISESAGTQAEDASAMKKAYDSFMK
ncbi:MAG: endonuclease IV, partial [Ruminiclostridium sp.]|nr:endonuclease IV [Ruminiclostridium sp.]